MTFKFSLQKILDLRALESIQVQQKVTGLQNSLFELRKVLEQERQGYFSDRDRLNEVVKQTEFPKIELYEQSLSLRQSKMMELLRIIHEIQTELNIENKNLVQAKLNKKIIEKLYTIKEKEYNKNEQLREQYQLDEMAMLRFRKNTIEEENEE